MRRREFLTKVGLATGVSIAASALHQAGAAPGQAKQTEREDKVPNTAPARQTKDRRILVFDVNETLLDLSPLKQPFAEAYGKPDALKTWFTTLLQYSNVATLTGDYHPFGELGLAAAETTARVYKVNLSPEQRKELVAHILTLPPHPEVKAALEKLKAAGFRMVSLTNSAPAAAEAQLKHAELRPLFEKAYSVESVRVYKPDRRTYEFVAADLGVSTADLRMVAAHGWDIAGAMAAGCAGAFIGRPGQELYPLAPPPDVVGPDLTVVAEHIIRVEQPA